MKIWTEPMTIEEIKTQVDDSGFITGVIKLDLSNLIDNVLEAILDDIAERLVGSPLLMEVSYRIVGHEGDTTLLLEVSGDASAVLREGDEAAWSEAG